MAYQVFNNNDPEICYSTIDDFKKDLYKALSSFIPNMFKDNDSKLKILLWQYLTIKNLYEKKEYQQSLQTLLTQQQFPLIERSISPSLLPQIRQKLLYPEPKDIREEWHKTIHTPIIIEKALHQLPDKIKTNIDIIQTNKHEFIRLMSEVFDVSNTNPFEIHDDKVSLDYDNLLKLMNDIEYKTQKAHMESVETENYHSSLASCAKQYSHELHKYYAWFSEIQTILKENGEDSEITQLYEICTKMMSALMDLHFCLIY